MIKHSGEWDPAGTLGAYLISLVMDRGWTYKILLRWGPLMYVIPCDIVLIGILDLKAIV